MSEKGFISQFCRGYAGSPIRKCHSQQCSPCFDPKDVHNLTFPTNVTAWAPLHRAHFQEDQCTDPKKPLPIHYQLQSRKANALIPKKPLPIHYQLQSRKANALIPKKPLPIHYQLQDDIMPPFSVEEVLRILCGCDYWDVASIYSTNTLWYSPSLLKKTSHFNQFLAIWEFDVYREEHLIHSVAKILHAVENSG